MPALRSLKASSGFDEDSEWIVMMVRGKWEGAWGKGVKIFNINVKKKNDDKSRKYRKRWKIDG